MTMTVEIVDESINVSFTNEQGFPGTGLPAGGDAGAPLRKNSSTTGDYSFGSVNKSWVGLDQVDNTPDLAKPVSNATKAYIDANLVLIAPQDVSASGYGETLTLENATGLKVGSTRSYKNESDYDKRIKNYDGTVLGFIPARGSAIAICLNISSTAGVWQLIGAKKFGTVASRSAAVSFGASGNFDVITIDNDRQLIVGSGTSTYAIVYNKTTNTWGNELLVRSGTTNNAKAIKVGTDNIMIVTSNATTGMEAVVLTATGVSLSPNTVGTATLAGNFSLWGSIISLSPTQYVISYSRATSVCATRVISLSGTTPSIGAEDTVTGNSGTPHLYANSASTYTAVSATPTNLYAKTNSVSGNTITPGTEVSTACSSATFRTMWMSTGRIAIMYLNTTTRGGFISVSGTTPSISSAALSSGTSAMNSGADWVAVSSTKIAVCTTVTNTATYFNNLIDTAGTASAGTEISLASTVADGVVSTISVAGNTARFYFRQASAAMHGVATVDASGTSPTATYTFSPITTGGAVPTSPPNTAAEGGAFGVNMMPSSGGVIVVGNTSAFSWLITDRFTKLIDTAPISTTVSKIGYSRNEAWSVGMDSGRWYLAKVEVAA